MQARLYTDEDATRPSACAGLTARRRSKRGWSVALTRSVSPTRPEMSRPTSQG
jgi:hypothetical protein